MQISRIQNASELLSSSNSFDDEVINRFNSFINKTENCWLWLGHKVDGYGSIKVRYREILAHRLSYYLFYGPITKGLCILHSCDTRACVNPEHLFIGTNKENVDDRVKKNRSNRVVTLDEAREIRKLYQEGNVTQMILAIRFNCCQQTISKILNPNRILREDTYTLNNSLPTKKGYTSV